MGFHLAHSIQENADQDKHTGAAEELGNRIRDVHLVVHENGDDGDDGEEDGSGQSDPAHGIMKIIAGGLAGAHTGNVAAVLLQIVCDLQFIELGGDPEIGKEQNHQSVDGEIEIGALDQQDRKAVTEVGNEFCARIMVISQSAVNELEE